MEPSSSGKGGWGDARKEKRKSQINKKKATGIVVHYRSG
jgi:hypothetical protein